MKLYIKNMVCSRCKMVLKAEIEKAGLQPESVELGEVKLKGETTKPQLENLNTLLKAIGFELIDNRKKQTIEKIKIAIISLVHHSSENINTSLSEFLVTKVHQDYRYLSNLFSEVEAITIEKYFITQRIERVKELLIYDELSLSQIADQLGYSSVAYLSNQFKKVTGLTPSFFKGLQGEKRKSIDKV